MKWIWIILIMAGMFGFGYLFENKETKIADMQNLAGTNKIRGVPIDIEIADTDKERIKGLSGRKNLEENEGLLFVFDTEGYHGIWMKDMNFNIDIAWLDKNKKIIHIEKNVSPKTYPKVFYAFEEEKPILSLYVLETKSDFFEKANIKVGDLFEF